MSKTSPIRILHVLSAMNMAGTETLLMNIYRNIDRNKVQFDFAVSSTEECDYDREIESLGGKIVHYPRYTGKNHFQYKKWWNHFLEEHPEYHIIHGHIGSTASIYLKIAKKKGRYAIAHSHSTKSTPSLRSYIYTIYAHPTRYIADFFFGCSKQALIDRYGAKIAEDKNRSKVLNNAIDASKFVFNPDIRKQIRSEYSVSDTDTIIGTVGRLTIQKNPFEIIKICKELKNRGVDFKFWWFGKGDLENKIKGTIKSECLEDVIEFMGTRSDVNNILQGMDIFLFPSLWEGLGIACVEAQAAGLPTLCSNTIPVEAKVTDMCQFIDLNDTLKWCDTIQNIIEVIKNKSYIRKNTYSEVVGSGYDIIELAKWLQDYYKSKGRNDE